MNDVQIKLKIKIQHFLSCNADSTQHIKKRKLQEAASKSEDYLPQPVSTFSIKRLLSFDYSL